MESVTRVQILNKTVCILLCVNAFGKGINPFVFSSVMDKLGSLVLVRQSV